MVYVKRITIFVIFSLVIAFLPLIYATQETDWLIQEYNKRDRSIEETALTILAVNKQVGTISSISSEVTKLKNHLDYCIQANNCNNKDVALAIWALKEIRDTSPTLDSATNWLINSRTIFAADTEADDWLVQVVSSASGNCIVNNTETKLERTISVSGQNTSWQSIKDLVTQNTKDLEIDCPSLTSVDSLSLIKKKAISGIVNYFIIEEIQNKKSVTVHLGTPCWGSTYRSICNQDTTAYVLLALSKQGKTLDPAWLKEQDLSSLENAILYKLTDKQEYFSALQSSQSQSGFWQPVNIETTSLIYPLISAQSEPAKKALGWIQGQRATEGCWPSPLNLCNVKSSAAAIYAIGTVSNVTTQQPPRNETTPPSTRTTLEDCDEPCQDKDGCICPANECKRSVTDEDETCEGPKTNRREGKEPGTYCVTERSCDGQLDRLGRCIDLQGDGCPKEDVETNGGTTSETETRKDTGTQEEETNTLFWILMIVAVLIALIGGSILAYKKGLIKFKKKPTQDYKPRMKPAEGSKTPQEYQPRMRIEKKHPVKKFLDNELDKSIEELEKLLKN
ncbi:MAG: hypothetical protein AABX49_01280 [Nanoarchaeota archaeon]